MSVIKCTKYFCDDFTLVSEDAWCFNHFRTTGESILGENFCLYTRSMACPFKFLCQYDIINVVQRSCI